MTAQRYRVGRWGMAEDAEGEWVAFEDFEVVERERDELIREVRAWACANCNTVFPGGPAYPGLKCVVCPSCGEVGMRPLLAYELEKVERERDELRGRVSELERLVEMGPVPPACSAEDFARAVLEVDALTRERDELRRRIAGLDCRFTLGGVAEAGGSHCPLDKPCARCVTEREVERLRRVEAAASEIIRYEDSGPPELHDWDAKHEALREALRHDDR